MASPLPDDAPLLSVEEVQRHLKRSRASIYRYANTDPKVLNPPYDANRLNPEVRTDRDQPLLFHPKEVRRFARDVLGLAPVIQVQPGEETITQELLRAILAELQAIREHLQSQV
ncbi:resolvase [Halomicronema hongdechloris]|nr:resolvase [Halomicronema hongdechloris]